MRCPPADALGLADGDPLELIVLPRRMDGERWIAGAVIHDGSGRIFMQRRSSDRDLFPGAWDIVGGHLEPGEGILDALRREVTEETGWTLRHVLDDLGITTYTGEDGVERHEVDYLVEVDGDLAAPRIEEHCTWTHAGSPGRGCRPAQRRAPQRRSAAPGHRAGVRGAGSA